MKDNFSFQSDKYAKYRPGYPSAFFAYLNSIVSNRQNAWDCGTGNGQVAYELSKTFCKVFATDISRSQINNARKADNIIYSVQPAEKTHFEDQLFDLIVIAQAIHWFDFEQFYAEVRRTSKNNGIVCVVGYGRVQISAQIDEVITDFYENIIGRYWDDERKYIDQHYATIPFPFKEIQAPSFVNTQYWTLEHLVGYLNTWSAVRHFVKQKGDNPVTDLQLTLEKLWGDEPIKEVHFPLLLRIGQIVTYN
jgi:ubiquinone/menaquinone biosynthesis C-methylase UbiE